MQVHELGKTFGEPPWVSGLFETETRWVSDFIMNVSQSSTNKTWFTQQVIFDTYLLLALLQNSSVLISDFLMLIQLTLLKGKVNFWELPMTCLITRYLLDKNIFIPVLNNKL